VAHKKYIENYVLTITRCADREGSGVRLENYITGRAML
jgi:hypothetical protein